jgi:SHS2 domain-containing protein
MHETFDHTADLGLRIRAPNLDALFIEAAQALFEAIVECLDTVALDQKVEIDLAGTEKDYLLFDWLKELLYRFDAEHLLFGRFEAHVTEDGLQGVAWGEPIDLERHTLLHEVKAITYHGLKVERTAGGWLAEVIVDI